MKIHLRILTCSLLLITTLAVTAADSPAPAIPTPTPAPALQPLEPGAKVIPLWPPGSPALKTLKGSDQPETLTMYKNKPGYVQKVVNIHNPSLEVHLAPPDKANGLAIIVAAGGGNTELNVGGEGLEIATWLNSLGISAFIERYRLKPYDSTVDALADTQRCFRIIRANAKEWGVDPNRVGIMGFSAGGEQAAWAALKFDAGNPDAADPIDRQSCRPDFTVLVYAGWARMDLSKIPKNCPPAFLTSAGVDDAFHARQTVEFYDALFKNKTPAELHIYGHGGHAGGIRARNGIPFGTWHLRFVEWITDLGMMKATAAK